MRWWLTGSALVGLHLALLVVSWRFGDAPERNARLGLLMAALGVAAGCVYLVVLPEARGERRASRLAWIIGVGVVLRAVIFPSSPMLETDFQRYLWDGALTAHGHSPYAWSPDEVIENGPGVPKAVTRLAAESGGVVARINHSHLRTIYPPTAQAAFALAHWVAPWRAEGLLLVFAVCDAATLLLLLRLLRRLALPSGLVAVYWWNPLLIKEIYNSCHMDVVLLPFVVGAVLLAVHRRYILSAVPLALATGAKVWPVLLAPVLMRPLWRRPVRLAAAVGVFAMLTALLFWPVLQSGMDPGSGFRAYSARWEMNDAAYMVLSGVCRGAAFLTGLSTEVGRRAARLLAGLIVVGVALMAARRPARDGADLCARVLLIVAVLFMISPTQFPWYFVWMLPFLAVRPVRGLLLLTAVLWVYYTRYFWEDLGRANVFHNGIVWLEYAPVWLLLIYDAWRSRRTGDPMERAA